MQGFEQNKSQYAVENGSTYELFQIYARLLTRPVASSIIGRGKAYIYIFVFTDFGNS